MNKTYFILLALLINNVVFSQDNRNIKWWNPAESKTPVISNQRWSNELESTYHRFPSRMKDKVRKPVWNLSKNSAGLSIRFWTNSTDIIVKYTLKGYMALPHMPATGVSGLDLYYKTYNGDWMRTLNSYSIAKNSKYHFIINNTSDKYKKYGREYKLLLPLYNEVDKLEIGVDENAIFKPMPPRNEKPIVAYGTSICQGACATRPGMAWTNILERRLEQPVINIGFSGNGKLEPEIIDLLNEIDAKVYILDCLPNLVASKDSVYQLTVNAVKQIRKKHPETPIILTSHMGYLNGCTDKTSYDKYTKLNIEAKKAFNYLKANSYKNLFRLTKEEIGLGIDSYVDYTHPNDYGMMQYADAYEKLIRKILKNPKGNISTTIPKSQSRDIYTYNWVNRHQKILELNKTNPPKICILGNSIVNFWGGEPMSINRGKKSWNKYLKPLGVRNYGFGWDYIENVLWRVQHDELDGFNAEQIIIMIGTNNISKNDSDEDIIKGIDNLIEQIKIKQPQSRIILVGILPRRNLGEKVEPINKKIEQLAKQKNITYANISGKLVNKNGKINEKLFTDGLHPNEKGYKYMAKKITELIKKIK